MPFYKHECNKCGETQEFFLKIDERDTMNGKSCETCKEGKMQRIIDGFPGFSDSWSLGIQKPPREFRELLSHMKKEHPGSTINDRL